MFDSKPCVGVKTDGGLAVYPLPMNHVIANSSELLPVISKALAAGSLTTMDERDAVFLPVTEPKKIICAGLNYKDHAEETGGTAPEHPVFFSKFNDALVPHNAPVTLPPWLQRYDYEAELVIVVGKSAYNVSVSEAKDCIFGYTCGNDLSARDSQFLSSQWLCGKSLPGSGPAGPYIVTRDSFDPYAGAGIYCEVNGERVQSGNTADMIFPCYETLSAASRFFPLSPGDLIFTGTPAGVIMGREKSKRRWLKPGDVVKVTIDGIGTLQTPLV
jgi:2-keto-4-pentenoate hydratase/2-oxohepta-3-ene-1,7-dioic acid hydratase in catechol pathway